MNTTSMFKLNKRAFILAVVSAAYPSLGYSAVAAKVEFVSGNVQVLGVDGREHGISKGGEINPGDTVQTIDGRAQLRFSDGGYISLQPNTQFRVDEYSYEGKTDGQEKGFFSLVKGGLRAITGAVGHVNKNNYRINTPVATIGIRGTEFLASYDTKLLVKVGNGAVYITNETGDLTLFQGQSGEVSGKGNKPNYSNEQPVVGAAGPQGGKPQQGQQESQQQQSNNSAFTVAEQYNSDGTTCVVTGDCAVTPSAGSQSPPTTPQKIVDIATAGFTTNSPTTGELEGSTQGEVITDAAGNITSVSNGTDTFTNFTGAVLEKTTDTDLSWVRFEGGTVLKNGTVTENNYERHIIYGVPTTAADISSLTIANAGAGSYGYYTLTGGTSPTDAAGHAGSLTGGMLEVYFTGSPTVYADLQFDLNGASFSAYGSGTFVGGSIFALTSGAASSQISSGSYYYSGGACASSCTFNALGFFAGPQAAQAGLSYLIQGTSANGDITGVAAFKHSGPFYNPNAL